MEDYSEQIRSATKWSAITNILSKITPPLTNIFLARLLTPEAFGVVATINMVITFADIFADAGFQKYLVQHEFENEQKLYENANVAFWSNFSISLFLWVIIFFFRNSLSRLVGSDGYGTHLSVAAFSIPLIAFSSIQQAIYKRNFDFKGMFVPKLVRSILPLIITVPVAFVCHNCWALIIGTLAANFSDALLLTIRSKWKPRFFYDFSIFREMFSFSCWTLLESLSIWLSANVDIFIIGRMLSNYYVGLYKASLTTVEQITTIIVTTIVPVLFATLSRLQNDEKEFKKMFYAFQEKCALILIPLSVGIFLYKDLVTFVLLGNQWKETIDFIGFLGLIQFLRILICYFASEVYRSRGEPKISFIIQMIYIIVLAPVLFISSRYGYNVVYRVRIGTYLFFTLMHLCVLKIRFKLSIGKMFKVMLIPGVASIIMGGIGNFFMLWNNSILMQFVGVGLCVIIYFIICIVIPSTRKTLFSFIKKNNP